MSTSKVHHEPPQPVRHSHLRLMGWYAAVFALLFLAFIALSAFLRSSNQDTLVIPDEKAAAADLLAKKFDGPRYFQVPEGDMRDNSGVTVKTTTEPHITAVAARQQVKQLVKERNLSAEQAAKVEALIERLTEQPSSRLVGIDHVNLLRLNLALDALR